MATTSPVVIKVSPMAHFAVGFLTLGLLVPVLTWPVSAPLLVIPVALSASIIRLRTLADERGVTVRTLVGSRAVRWDDIDGLRFHRGSWARNAQGRYRAAIARGDLCDAAAPDRSQLGTGPQPVPMTAFRPADLPR
ncbi:PH domain-containing protein [Mycobacterium tuberculosis]